MWKAELKAGLSCVPEEGKELSPLSTLGVGGRCEFFVEPSDLKDVSLVFEIHARAQENFPIFILGGGSNVVFADGMLDGVVLSSRRLNRFKWSAAGDLVMLEAEAGHPLSSVVSDSVRDGLTGAEFAVGIPGTLGGAMAGNAGVGERSIGDLLEEVTTVENRGNIRTWKRGEFAHSYRYFSLSAPDRFLAGCKVSFRRMSRAEIEVNLDAFRQRRAEQPQGVRSAGCAFKNPPLDSAGRLLDASGCKGLRVGGAMVSNVHANFIVNTGHATGSDVFELMRACHDIVLRKTGTLLEPEIKLLGFPT
ncbi:MAG: UDP-N-acetylmuramate dehydrogenase [Syntrophorhabdaceae bacterium]|nr:UDP-N-acetylmuramate dehydrogenase [Syntrophorhabdaceae bacterium]